MIFPDHVKLGLSWYGKGISEENSVDKFISLYECTLALVSRWHYVSFPNEYDGRDPPPRKMFGDWVRQVALPGSELSEAEEFRPFDVIVERRNRVFKANDLLVHPDDAVDVVHCATQMLNWAVQGHLPQG